MLSDIRIYDYEFNLLHIEPDISSSNWRIMYNDIGTFELHFARSSALAKIVYENEYLIAVQGDLAAIITGKNFTNDGVIYGRTLNYFLERRVTPKFKETQKDVETIARIKVSETMDFLTLGNVTGFTKLFDILRTTYHSTFEVVKECLDNDNAGHVVKFDLSQKKYVFQVLKGIENSLILSYANNNIFDDSYIEDWQDYNTAAWFEMSFEDKGEWNAQTNIPTLTDNLPANFGLKYKVEVAGTRFYIPGTSTLIQWTIGDFIVCKRTDGKFEKMLANDDSFWYYINRDVDKIGIYKHETVLETGNLIQATETLSKRLVTRETKTSTRDVIWGEDYQLGDIVRLQTVIGGIDITTKQRIIGVDIWYEANGIGQQPILQEVTNGDSS